MGASSSTESEMAAKGAAKDFVNAQIGNNKIVVFSKTYCPHCKKAKNVLDKVGASGKYIVIELDNRDDGSTIQDVLQEMTGARTVPRVFINGKSIGGSDDTLALYEKGELAIMVKE